MTFILIFQTGNTDHLVIVIVIVLLLSFDQAKGIRICSSYVTEIHKIHKNENKRGHPHIRVNPRCTKEGPWGEKCLSTDKATHYK